MIKKNITVTPQQDEWIKAQIASGHCGNDSELIRDLIRREQLRSEEVEKIRQKLIVAEQSVFVDKTAAEMLEGFKKKARENGEL